MASYTRLSSLYDILMADVDYDAWANYLDVLIRENTKSARTITDIACGTGAISIRLAACGYDVTGIDISADMLKVAYENARNARADVHYAQMDMRCFSLHRPCDVITCTCDGVNYLTSKNALDEFFACAYRALKPDGMLLFDVSSRHKLKDTIGNNTFTLDDGERAYIWNNSYNEEKNTVQMDLTFFSREKSGLYSRFTETHIQRAHSIRQLYLALEHAGFGRICDYSAFTHSPSSDTDERVQILAVK